MRTLIKHNLILALSIVLFPFSALVDYVSETWGVGAARFAKLVCGVVAVLNAVFLLGLYVTLATLLMGSALVRAALGCR